MREHLKLSSDVETDFKPIPPTPSERSNNIKTTPIEPSVQTQPQQPDPAIEEYKSKMRQLEEKESQLMRNGNNSMNNDFSRTLLGNRNPAMPQTSPTTASNAYQDLLNTYQQRQQQLVSQQQPQQQANIDLSAYNRKANYVFGIKISGSSEPLQTTRESETTEAAVEIMRGEMMKGSILAVNSAKKYVLIPLYKIDYIELMGIQQAEVKNG